MMTGPSKSADAQLDTEGRHLVEIALDQSAAQHLQSAITQALHCLDRGLELSCSASSEIEHFLQLHPHADGALGACVRGLHWLLLRLAARDAVRKVRIVEWIHFIREHAVYMTPPLLDLANALDAGLHAAATGEPLEEKYHVILTRWGTGDCDPGYKENVQQLLKQCS
jgi:hypothetical protein